MGKFSEMALAYIGICGDLFSALGLLYILISIQTGHIGIVPIVIGVTINSVFVSLLDPSYRATVTDLLTEEEYAKASGLVQMASNSRYLISPAIAGVILGFSDIRVILIIDILTIFVTVFAVASVRRTIQKVKPRQDKFDFSKILMVALIACGCFMALVGTSTSMVFILIASILFFASLPFVNTCADVLIRVSIPNEVQGRVWGLISLLTQIGCVIAYATCGILADYVFQPMMEENGVLAGSIGKVIGTGQGRGIGLILILAGVLMVVVALVLGSRKSIRLIEVINCEHELKNVQE